MAITLPFMVEIGQKKFRWLFLPIGLRWCMNIKNQKFSGLFLVCLLQSYPLKREWIYETVQRISNEGNTSQLWMNMDRFSLHHCLNSFKSHYYLGHLYSLKHLWYASHWAKYCFQKLRKMLNEMEYGFLSCPYRKTVSLRYLRNFIWMYPFWKHTALHRLERSPRLVCLPE